MCSRTTWSRPRPQNFVLEVYSRLRPVLEDPHTWVFFTARRYAESGYATSPVCPSLSNSMPYCRHLCACVWSIVFMVLSPLLINHTQKFNVLRPDLEARPRIVEAKAKAKVRGLRGQGQCHKIMSSRCPRGRGQSSRTGLDFLTSCLQEVINKTTCIL